MSHDVAYWHIASFRCAAEFCRYRSHSGHQRGALFGRFMPRFTTAERDRRGLAVQCALLMSEASRILRFTNDFRAGKSF